MCMLQQLLLLLLLVELVVVVLLRLRIPAVVVVVSTAAAVTTSAAASPAGAVTRWVAGSGLVHGGSRVWTSGVRDLGFLWFRRCGGRGFRFWTSEVDPGEFGFEWVRLPGRLGEEAGGPTLEAFRAELLSPD